MVEVTHCPTAYAMGGGTIQGAAISDADRHALKKYNEYKDRRSIAARERMYRVRPWEKSTRNRRTREIPL